MAAWKGGHRPGTTPQQWAFARVNSFVTKQPGTWGKADKDLADKVRAAESVEIDENRAIVYNPRMIRAFIKQVEKKFPKYKGEIEQIEKDEIVFPNDPKLKDFFRGAKEVKFVLSDSVNEETIEEAMKFWTVTITKKAGKLFKGQTVDVKARNSAEAIKKGIKQMKGNPMTVPSGSVDAVLGESNNLEEAALPFKELEKAWIRTKGNDKKRAKLIKKHKLKPLIANVRQGSIKLGPMNDLKMKDGNHTMAGLDAEGELIFISNNPVRIHYPSNTKDRPKGTEMKENTLQHQRLVRVVEVALGERPENTNDFIKESNIDLTMTPSSIQKAYKEFNIKK
jgi:hypothetical protein